MTDTVSENESSVESTTPDVSEVELLLGEEIFSPLRLALAKENIHTIEELKALKLWAFMNRNNLYSISTRQNVLIEVRQLLEQETTEAPKHFYELHCGSAVYSGDTIARTFLHFCENIAKNHPLFFRSLLDKAIGSTSDVIIYRSPENGNYIRMENPTCFVSTDIEKDSVISAVEWIIQQCVGEEMPVSLKELYPLLD